MDYDINQLIMAETKIKHFLRENLNLFRDCDIEYFLTDGILPHLLREINKINDVEQEQEIPSSALIVSREG